MKDSRHLFTEEVTENYATPGGGMATRTFWIVIEDHVVAYGRMDERISRAVGRGETEQAALVAAEARWQSETKTFTVTNEQWAFLVEALGDAYAYRTNSGEGADDEDDQAAADRTKALADALGVTLE